MKYRSFSIIHGIKIDRFKEITEKEIYAYYPERKEISEE